MAERVYDDVVTRRTISPAVRANGTVNGVAVDRAANGGAEEAIVVVTTGTITDGSHAVAVEDSDDGSTGWVAVPAGQLTGTPPTIADVNDDAIYEIGVAGSRRYLRVSVVTTGATSGGAFSAVIVLGGSRFSPASHS
ncbi:MAG: hypothetical protein ACRDT2_02020 [Natronosporangium sp.]